MNIKGLALKVITLVLIAGCTTLNATNTPVSDLVIKENLNEPAICQNDPHVFALRDALNPFYISALSLQLQNVMTEMMTSGRYKSYSEALANISMDVSKIKMSGNNNTGSNVVYTASWATESQSTRILDITYSSPQASSISRLRWVITLNKIDEDVNLSQVNSFIDGTALHDLMNRDGPQTPKITFCLVSVLMDAFQSVNYDKIISSDDIANWLGSSPIIGNRLAEKHENDLGRICKYSFSSQNGTMVAEFLGRCP